MNDFIHAEKFNHIKLPILKGHVKIELKDVRTGKRETAFEGENMITNALRDIFASNYCGALDYQRLLPIYSKMLGGVLCFRNTLDVSSADAADDYFIPDESVNSLIAHAGQTALSDQADDIKRGNPLNTSMVVTDGVVTLAYEWGSAAGNGTISSVALTHSDVGDAGTGSNSQAFSNMKPVINAGYNQTITNRFLFFDNDGYGYRFSVSGTTVTIKKIPMAYRQTGLVAAVPFVDTDIIETHTVSTNTNFGTPNPFYCYDSVNHNLWLFYNTGKSRNIACEQINLNTYTAINRDFQTDSVQVGRLNSSNANIYPQALFDGTYVYFRIETTDSLVSDNVLKVKLPPNHADQSLLTATCLPYGGLFIPTASHKILAGKSMVINNNQVFPTSADDTFSNYGLQITALPFMNTNPGLAVLGGQEGTNPEVYYVAISKFYLGTKFNLPTPIQKSNTQSMVITYTLTEVEEES